MMKIHPMTPLYALSLKLLEGNRAAWKDPTFKRYCVPTSEVPYAAGWVTEVVHSVWTSTYEKTGGSVQPLLLP